MPNYIKVVPSIAIAFVTYEQVSAFQAAVLESLARARVTGTCSSHWHVLLLNTMPDKNLPADTMPVVTLPSTCA
jgi:hypothetical protein